MTEGKKNGSVEDSTRLIELLPCVVFNTFGENKDAIVKDVQWRIPLGRAGTSDEGGEVLAFMLSDRASFMTGEVLVSDGGSMNMQAFTDALCPPEDRLFEPSQAHRERCEAQL